MKTFTSLFLSIITIVALGFTQKANAQDCTINMSGCPPTMQEACATTQVSGLDGAYVSWTPPSFSLNCNTQDPAHEYSFYMEFDLPESQSHCWVFSGVQRQGNNNLSLFQSKGNTSEIWFITPLQYIQSGAVINARFIDNANKSFTWVIQALDDKNNPVWTSSAINVTSTGVYSISIPNSPTFNSGAYYLKYIFNGTNLGANDAIEIDRLYYNAIMFDQTCAGGINFTVVSSKGPGSFFPVGSSLVTYTATYTPTSGTPITQTCSFNVVVNKLSISNVSTTSTTCNGNNGSITFTASSANTSANHLEYSLDGTTWYPISGGNVVTTTPQAGTTTTSWQATMTIPAVHAQTYSLQVRDTQKGCPPASQSVTVLNTADTQAPTFTRPADITIYTDANCTYNASPSVTGDVTNESDNCSTGLNATYSDVVNNGTCTGSKIITRTWHLVDNNNNAAADQVQTITILDNIVPIWTTTAGSLNRTVECNDADGLTAAQALAPVATDNCSSVTYTKTSGTFVPGTCGATGTYTHTWVAKDACLNTSAVFTQVITITDNSAPTWTTTAGSLDRTIECSDATTLSNAQALAPTATDNCGSVTYTKTSGAFVAGSCGATGSYTNTWEAKDACQNTSSVFTQVITITDKTAPTWTTTAGSLDRSVECSDATALADAQVLAPTATDNCGSVTYTKTSGTFVPGTCGATGTYTNTWVAKDACQNTSSVFTQVITITDKTAPTWTTTAGSLDRSVECSDATALADAQVLAPIATDNCGSVTYTKTSGTFVPGPCGATGTYTNTWVAKDACQNTSSVFTQVITITDKTAPTWTTTAGSLDRSVECSDATALADAQVLAPIATDNCGSVTYTKTSGAFVAGSCGATGSYTNTWEAKDACQNTSSVFTQVITITDKTAPTWTTTAGSLDRSVECSDATALADAQVLAPTATDNCGSVTCTKTSGTFVPGPCGATGTYTNTWVAKDACLNTSTVFTQKITIIDTKAPAFVIFPADVTVECDAVPAVAAIGTEVTATDNCDANVTITYEGQTRADGSCPDSYILTRTWKAVDNCNNETTKAQVITVKDTKAPSFVIFPADVTVECDAVPAVAAIGTEVTATDNCDANVTITYEGQTRADGSCPNSYTLTRIWKAVDNCNNETTKAQVITVQDKKAPAFVIFPADVTVECDAVPTVAAIGTDVTATDNCDADVTITYEGQVRTDGVCADSYILTRTWKATDNCGNSITKAQTITVQDTKAPVLSAAPADVTVECNAVPVAATLTATDNCDAAPVVTYKEVRADGACPNTYTLTRTWTATDACSNSSSKTQVITVQDKKAPVLSEAPTDITVESNAVPTAATLTATDNCDAAPVVTYTEVRTDGNCPNNYTLTRTWTATDACGNSSSKTQIIKVQDTAAPVLSDAPADVTVECNAIPDAATLTASDYNSTDIPVTYTEVRTNGACPSTYTLIRTWTATDACSNSASKTQVIKVQDTTAPVLSEAPADVTVECNAVPVAATLTATDNCDAAPVVTYKEVRTDGVCPSTYTLTRTWTATDACSNSASKTQVIKVQDTTAPVLSEAPADVTVECNAVPVAVTLTATDNCDAAPVVTYKEVRTDGVCPSTYTLTRTWTATDACSNSASKTQVIKVQDTTAPVVSEAPADVTVECNAVPVAATLTATDNCDAAPVVTYKEVRTDGVCPSTYMLTRTWTATDACSNSASKTQVIKVQDTTAPVLSEAPADVTVECNAVPVAAILTATDNCDAAPVVTYKEVRADGVCPSTYTLTRTWTATDACNNSASKTQVIKVQDTTAPVLSEAPADVTVECNAVPVAATLTATDNCDAAPVVTYKEVRTDGVCPSAYTLTRTWTATDACSNSASKAQVIKVQDTTAPALVCPPSQTVFVDVDKNFATVTIAAPTVTDNCGQVKYSNDFNHTMNASGQYPIGTTTVTWTATDECGNTTSCTQTITVVDNQNPLFTKCFTGQNVSFTSQSGVYTYTIKGTAWDATATDNDALASLIYDMTGATTGSGTTLDNAILNVGVTNIKWTATDKSGNKAVCEYAIMVIYGNVPPIAVDDNVSTAEDVTATGNVLANDTDPDVTNVLTVTGFVWNGTTYLPGTATSAEGTLTLNANGGFTFVPTLNYNGAVPAITYMISDGVGGTASAKLIITVTAVNDPPVARPDVYTTPEDTPVSGNVLANDSDVDGDPLSVANIVVGEKVYTTPASVNVSSTGTLVAAANGAFTFTPALNFNGKVPTVFYRATDGSAVISSTLDITVTAANDNPVANADVKSTPEDTPLIDNVLTNDTDVDGDPLTVTGFTIGSTVYSTGATATITGIGTIIINTNGSYTFTPTANYNGPVPVITYNISDGNGGTASGTLTITVSSVSDPPVAVNDNVTMIQNTSTTINVLANDSFGPDGPSTTAITATSAAHGTVTVNNGGTPNNPTDDKIVYTPTTGYTGADSFTYTITASNGLTSTATVTITVRPFTDMMTFNKRSTQPVDNGDGTVNWKYTISVTNKLTTDSITSIHITDDLSRVILSPMEFRVVSIIATGKLKANGLFDGVTRTNLLLDGSAVAPNSTEEITIEVHTTLNRFFGTVYNQAVLDGSSKTTGAISNILSDDPSNTEGAFPRPTKTEIPEILIIPDAFTPNQDGHNDKFTIIHSSRITISLEVFNRWGNKVYESNDYQNDWDGKGSGHLLGQNLPSGTYYYIIVIRNTGTNKVEKRASYITLRR